jgi:hypothetical protein
MKKLALLFVLFAAPCFAQTSVPKPSLFTMSGNYAAFTGTKTTTPVVVATAAVQVTNHFSFGYEHIQATSGSLDARWELGIGAYTRQLNELLGANLSSKILFDVSQIGVTFTAGGGKLLQPTVNRIAETAGVHFSYPLADHISMQVIGVDILHGGVQTGILTTNTTASVSSGINIYF